MINTSLQEMQKTYLNVKTGSPDSVQKPNSAMEENMKRHMGILIVLALCAIPGQAIAIGVEAAVGGWYQTPEVSVAYKPLASAVNEIDIDDEANYDEETGVLARIKVDMPLLLPNIYVMATPMEFEGRGRKSQDFKFGDDIFTANVDFDSRVVLDHYDVALFWGVPLLETATFDKLNAEFGINVRIINLEAEVVQPATGLSERTDETLGVPMLYLGAQLFPIEKFGIEVEGRGIAYSDNHFYDLIGRLKLKMLGPVFVAGGWRYEDVKIDEDDVKAELTFSGPFLEAGFSF